MKNLQMSLILFWFSMTKNLIKKEDYRSITPYWCNRFLLFNGENKSKKWWNQEFFRHGTFEDTIENIELFCSFKSFEYNIMTLGYPKAGDSERILKLEHKGIEIRTGNVEWGAEADKLYFVIKHGNVINE
jgi:hypothetical protein